MPLQDWIHKYPGVQALLQGKGDRLSYSPDDAPSPSPVGSEHPPRSMGLKVLAFPEDTTRPLVVCAYRAETTPHTWTQPDLSSELDAVHVADRLGVPGYLVLITPPPSHPHPDPEADPQIRLRPVVMELDHTWAERSRQAPWHVGTVKTLWIPLLKQHVDAGRLHAQ